LKTVQKFIPAGQQTSLRAAQAGIAGALAGVQAFDVAKKMVATKVLPASIGFGVLFWLLFVTQRWQSLMMQILLTLGLTGAFVPASPFGRALMALYQYRSTRQKVSTKALDEGYEHQLDQDDAADEAMEEEKELVRQQSEALLQDQPKPAVRGTSLGSLHKATPELAPKPRVRGLILKRKESLRPANQDPRKHVVSRHHAVTLTSLDDAAAVKMLANEDAGGNNFHRFTDSSFSKPTWCADCGHFLWGVSAQGLKCESCDKAVCKACAAELAAEHREICQGERAKKRAEANAEKNNPFQCCSRGNDAPR